MRRKFNQNNSPAERSSSTAGKFRALTNTGSVLVAILVTLASSRSNATDYTYISSSAANWTSDGVWQNSTGSLTGNPNGSGDNVVGNNAIGILTVDADREINNFTISTVSSGTAWNIIAAANRTLTIDGTLEVDGAGTVTIRNGGNPLALTAGNITVNSGQLNLGNATTQLGNLSVSGTTQVGAGAILSLNVNKPSVSLGGLVVDGTANLNLNKTITRSVTVTSLGGAGVIESNGSPVTLTLTSSASGTFSGVIQNGTAGTVAFSKAGSGTQVLSGDNSYSGATTVTAGTLLVSGGLGATDVSIAGGATLGVGKAAGAASFKTLTVSSVSVGSVGTESTIALDLGTSGSTDALATTGALTLSNGQKLNLVLTDTTLVGLSSSLSGTYTLLTWNSGNLIDPLSQLDLTNSSANIDLSQLSIVGNSLEYTAVPEPATWALLGLSAVWAWRNRRKKSV